MDNKVSIKNVYLYNEDLHNLATKKEKKKRIIWTIVSLFITLLSTFSIVYIITNDWVKNLVVLYVVLMVLTIIFFFVFMYNFFTLASFLGLKVIFSDRAYAMSKKFFDDVIMFNAPYRFTIKKIIREYISRMQYITIEIKNKLK